MVQSAFEAFLKRVYQATGVNTQNDLANILGVNRSAITQARKKGTIPDKWILKLYRSFGLNPDWLESGIGPHVAQPLTEIDSNFQQVPKVTARLSAGGGSFEVGSEIEGYYAFRKDWLLSKGNAGRMVLLDIFGNSMEPELKDGDSVLIDESQKDIIAGAVYAVGVEDTILVKRVEKHPNKLVLRSDNTAYVPIFLEGDEADSVRIIGKVIWVCREFR
jgi:phage repressor protein C with HTH and peptisase S24 domain